MCKSWIFVASYVFDLCWILVCNLCHWSVYCVLLCQWSRNRYVQLDFTIGFGNFLICICSFRGENVHNVMRIWVLQSVNIVAPLSLFILISKAIIYISTCRSCNLVYKDEKSLNGLVTQSILIAIYFELLILW